MTSMANQTTPAELPRSSATCDPWEAVDGFMVTQVLLAASELGVLKAVSDGPCSTEQLVELTNVPMKSLLRLLRALIGLKILTFEPSTGEWSRPSSDENRAATLRADAAFGAYAHLISTVYGKAWSHLQEVLVTGRSGVECYFGVSLWTALEAEPSRGAAFAAMMRWNNEESLSRLLETYDFPHTGNIVDIGAGDATFLCQLLLRSESLQATAFETMDQIRHCRYTVREHGLARRCNCVAGDFRIGVPGNADTYLLRSVLHNWNDEDATNILRVCANAMTSRSLLLVIERVAEDNKFSADSAFRDLNMMVLFGAADRTVDEYTALFETAGMVVVSYHHDRCGLSVFEVRLDQPSLL